MFTFKILLAVVFLANQAFAQSNVKCGTPTPVCVISTDGTVDSASTVALASGLVCDRDHKLYITKDFKACCQPKGAIIVPDTTTTLSPKDAHLLDIVVRMKEANAYLTDCIARRDENCTTSAIAKAAVVVTDAVQALDLLK